MRTSTRLLDGIRVLDVGTFIFGPAAATVMSDFGAEVIKVEAPGIGDPYRYLVRMPPLPACEHNYCWILDNRNKKSIALDLKMAEGRKVLLDLIARSDVFVTNFPPAVLQRLHLSYEDLGPLHERLIYAQATGYGEEGDECNKPGYDATAWWARSGLMDIVRSGEGAPALSPPGMGDHPSAMALLAGIMMALYQRERTGQGTRVTSSLMANGVWTNSAFIQAVLCGGPAYQRVTHEQTPNALVNTYQCRDGRWFFLVLVQEEKDWERFADSIDRRDLITDPRFSDRRRRRAHAAELVGLLDEVFAGKDYAHWREALDAGGITFGAVTRLDEIPDDPQMVANGMFMEIDHPTTGHMRTVNSPIWLDGQEKVRPRLAPRLGEHTEELLTWLGYDDRAIEALRACGAIP